MDLFEKKDIENLIDLFALKLDAEGIEGSISIVGGAALSLAYITDRYATTDIDATFPVHPRITEIIQEIALEQNLAQTWINDAVKAYVPFETVPMWVDFKKIGNIQIRIGSAEFLLAMKLKADRGFRDRPDIAALIKLCGLTSLEEIEDLYGRYQHQEILCGRTKEFLCQVLREK